MLADDILCIVPKTANKAAALLPPDSSHTYVPASENCVLLMRSANTVGLDELGVTLNRETSVQLPYESPVPL